VPTYVYRCQQCGTTIERRQSFQDPPLTICEACQGELRRVLQPVGIIFKGSGFYTTDYKGGASKSSPGETTSTTESSDSKSSTSSDSGTKSDTSTASTTAEKSS